MKVRLLPRLPKFSNGDDGDLMPGWKTRENAKRFGGIKQAHKYENIKMILLKKKEKEQKKPVTAKQMKNIKTAAAKITNASR